MKIREKYTCPLELVHDMIKEKWKPIILWRLRLGNTSFTSLQKDIEGITEKMLLEQLKELMEFGFVNKKYTKVILYVFNKISEKYDKQRNQLLPCFDDYYSIPLTVLDFDGENPNILDIGSETGLFSDIVLQKYPKAKFTLIDLSDKMLEVAKERFKDYTDFKFIVDDYTKHDFEEKFDIIISALSIHHLSAFDKENLYQKCYDMLNENGVFINVDQVLSPSPEIEALFSKLWRESVEKSGLNSDEVQKAYERVSFDNPSTLADQLKWLNKAGFKNADSLYKYYHFCVLYAKK